MKSKAKVVLIGIAAIGIFAAVLALLRLERTEQRRDPSLEATTSAPSDAQAIKRIYATAWGMTLDADGTGFYNGLMDQLLADLDAQVSYDIRPYRRAKALFLRDKTSCLYPSNIQLLLDGGEIEDGAGFIESVSLLKVKVFIFSRPGTEPPSNLGDVAGKTVAYAMGSRVPAFLKGASAEFIAVADETDKAHMLLSGRVDMMSAAMPDAKFVFDALNAPLPPFDAAYLLNDTGVRITCHNTPENSQFIQVFNARLDALLANGVLGRFLQANGLDPALYLPHPQE